MKIKGSSKTRAAALRAHNAQTKPGRVHSEAECLEMAAKVDAYRKANPKQTVDQALVATGVDMKYGNYWTYRKKLIDNAERERLISEAQPPSEPVNGEQHTSVSLDLAPLRAAFPQKSKQPKKKHDVVIDLVREPPREHRAQEKLAAISDLFDALARLTR